MFNITFDYARSVRSVVFGTEYVHVFRNSGDDIKCRTLFLTVEYAPMFFPNLEEVAIYIVFHIFGTIFAVVFQR